MMIFGIIFATVGVFSAIGITIDKVRGTMSMGGFEFAVSIGMIILGTVIVGPILSENPVAAFTDDGVFLEVPFLTHILLPSAGLIILSIIVGVVYSTIIEKFKKD